MTHELKSLPEFFQAVWIGDKTFEIRKNDRDFKERDEVILNEFEPEDPYDDGYTGRRIYGVIRYITRFEQKDGYVVFALKVTNIEED